MPTQIPWAHEVWNCVTGCTQDGPGCRNCYAKKMAYRLRGRCGYPQDRPFAPGIFHPGKAEEPFRWRKPKVVFVSSMGDLFHKEVEQEKIDKVLAVIRATPQHTYVMLTRRARRMRQYFANTPVPANVVVGVSVENQKTADSRVPHLLAIKAEVHLVCAEPLLGPLVLGARARKKVSWVLCGAESGTRKARLMDPAWARSLRDQCLSAGIPFFLQNGFDGRKSVSMPKLDGRRWAQFPACFSSVPEIMDHNTRKGETMTKAKKAEGIAAVALRDEVLADLAQGPMLLKGLTNRGRGKRKRKHRRVVSALSLLKATGKVDKNAEGLWHLVKKTPGKTLGKNGGLKPLLLIQAARDARAAGVAGNAVATNRLLDLIEKSLSGGGSTPRPHISISFTDGTTIEFKP